MLVLGWRVATCVRNASANRSAPGLRQLHHLNFAWGFGVVWGCTSPGVSGAHITGGTPPGPATRRSRGQGRPYIVAQLLGRSWRPADPWNFYAWFNQVDRERHAPGSSRPSPTGDVVRGGLRSEIIGTAILLMLLRHHRRPHTAWSNMAPFSSAWRCRDGMSLGRPIGYAINQALTSGRGGSWVTAGRPPGASRRELLLWAIMGTFSVVPSELRRRFVRRQLPAAEGTSVRWARSSPNRATT